MDVLMPDGTTITGVPDGTTKAQLQAKLNYTKSGDKSDLIPQSYAAPETSKALPIRSDLVSNAEALTGLATGAVGGLAGAFAAAGQALTGSNLGTGVKPGEDIAANVMQRFTYQPRTEGGQERLQQFGDVLGASKLAGLGPAEALPVASLAGPAMSQAGRAVPRVADILPKREPAAIPGMGSAMTDEARLRTERAQALPVPIQLTKGQATRTFEQQQFERETAKNPTAGEPLRARFSDQNQRILQNFDAWLDQTGAEAGSLRATGQVVTDALSNKAKLAKTHIDAAYQKARASGAMEDRVDIQPLMDFLESKKAQTINAGVLGSTKQELNTIAGPQRKDVFGQPIPRTVSINDLEEVRKSVGAAGLKDRTNGMYSAQIKGLIDQVTEGAGGDAYKYARRLRTQYSKEFEDVGVIDRLLRTKPGTSDRAVAYEDVFDHSILKGSLDDVRAVRKTLQTGGPNGDKAWKELQGATIQHIKDQITKSPSLDVNGNRVPSAAQLDRLVTALDKDGKLDFIFGKQGGQQIREVNAIAKDVLTSPPGSVNTSNTASALLAGLDMVAGMGMTGFPVPIGHGIKYGVQKLRARALDKRVQDALTPQGTLANIQARADGGPISAGKPYLVGENGPELVIPRQNGQVVPQGTLASLADEMRRLGPAHARRESALDLAQIERALRLR